MPARPAIVTTVRDAGAVLDSFIRYHLGIGFDRIFIFFDDPNDPFIEKLTDHPKVTAIPQDDTLRASWRKLRQWADMRRFIDEEVMARQILNCELAISLATDAGCDWILHIDVDEALLCEAGNAPMLFERLDADGINQATFKNFEALPEQSEVDDYFREVTLFKVNPNRMGKVRFGPTQIALARQAHFFRGDNFNFYFNLYATGKSAGKIDPFLMPVDVHNFIRRLQFKQQIDCNTRILGDNAIILHYPNCGLQNFITKYKTLGDFRDRWFGNNEVFPFHREARDICATGDDEAVIKFYRERVLLHPDEDLERLLEHGILARITAPADMIEHLRAGGPSL